MAANYNRAAWFYDVLAGVVFGKSQIKAQNHFLYLIPAGARILVAGGGTGHILEALTRLHPADLHIVYVEISVNMVTLARKKQTGANVTEFITADVGRTTFDQPFDVIITAFLLDNFAEPELTEVVNHLHQQLKPGGLWLNTDFQLTGPLWQKVLLKTMYRFFKLLRAVEVNELPYMDSLFKTYRLLGRQKFYGSFILASAYRK